MTDAVDSRYRLSRVVVPSAYRLRLEPDLDALRFDGVVEIEVEVAEPTRAVVLNAVELEIHEVSASLSDGAFRTATASLDESTDRATLTFVDELPAGSAVLRVTFTGVLNDRLVGFYRSTFTDVHGVERAIATSQLAATDARRAFPCFDEPAFKATFAVTLVVPQGLEAYSNAPVASESTLDDGRRELAFRPTMSMSTYLVAFVVGPFVASDVVDVDGVPLSVVCAPGKEHLTDFALDIGAFSLRFFADYFGIAYPGEKLDLVAIPDFAYGAMENLGCITFRETNLLIDPSSASTDELQQVAMVVAHEVAHMWFGDLVTMQWWEGIWLNEAFATFLQYVCTDAYRPEWKLWIRFNDERESALVIDGLHSTRAIEFPVHSPADADAMLDAITYQKGGSVLRMLEQYLGADVYRDGIRRYLATHAYANTVTSDLWDALESVSGRPVGEIMGTWILQGGHPVVTVDDGGLSQAPFSFGPPSGASAIGERWEIPVLTRSIAGGDAVTQLLGDTSIGLGVSAPAVVNAGGSGVYRTSYDGPSLESISSSLGALTEIERAVLVSDTRALALAGRRSVADVLTLAAGLGVVVEPSPWATVVEFLCTLDRIAPDDVRPALRSKAHDLLSPVLAQTGWDPSEREDGRTGFVRASLILGLGRVAEDADVRAEAASRFDSGVVEGDTADAVIAVVAAMNRPGDRDEMLRRFQEAKDPQSAARYRLGVASIADRELAVATFRACFELFRSQDAPRVIAQLVRNPTGGRAVWEALAESWDATVARVTPLMQFTLGAGLPALIDDRRFAERVLAFHEANPVPTGQQRIKQSLERMMNGVAFAERARPTLADALA